MLTQNVFFDGSQSIGKRPVSIILKYAFDCVEKILPKSIIYMNILLY